ncbi:MAG: carboxypeptidase regulatory-like domain-containing protein [Candidatus Hydrogenedentes bacterium]|nr:carboxypeptidase regulatory-like domain-containing protein [Candidatus Hydrogenedentota bacterium]
MTSKRVRGAVCPNQSPRGGGITRWRNWVLMLLVVALMGVAVPAAAQFTAEILPAYQTLNSLASVAPLYSSLNNAAAGGTVRYSWREAPSNPVLGLLPPEADYQSALAVYFPKPGRYEFRLRAYDGTNLSSNPAGQEESVAIVDVPGFIGDTYALPSEGAVKIPNTHIRAYSSAEFAEDGLATAGAPLLTLDAGNVGFGSFNADNEIFFSSLDNTWEPGQWSPPDPDNDIYYILVDSNYIPWRILSNGTGTLYIAGDPAEIGVPAPGPWFIYLPGSRPGNYQFAEPIDATESDSQGRYRLECVSFGTTPNYLTWYYLPEYLLSDIDVEYSNPQTIYKDFGLARPNTTLTGTITDRTTGRAITNAVVSWVTGAVQSRTDTTNTQGVYSISGVQQGAWYLQIYASGYQTELRPVYLDTDAHSAADDGEPYAYSYTLNQNNSQASLTGTVTLVGTTTPISGARVYLGTGQTTVTDVDGNYRFNNIGVGQYVMHFDRDGFEPARQLKVAVKAGANVQDVSLRYEGPGPVIRGNIQSAGGPAANVLVGVVDERGVLSHTDVTDGTGYYQLVGVPLGVQQLDTPGFAIAGGSPSVNVTVLGDTQRNLVLLSVPPATTPSFTVSVDVAETPASADNVSGPFESLQNLASTVVATASGVPAGTTAVYSWRESPLNPAQGLIPSNANVRSSINLAFPVPGLYAFSVQVRSGSIFSNTAAFAVAAPGVQGQVSVSPSDGSLPLSNVAVRAYTNYNAALAWQENSQLIASSISDSRGYFNLDTLNARKYWIAARDVAGNNAFKTYGAVNYGPVCRYASPARAYDPIEVNLRPQTYAVSGTVYRSAARAGNELENVLIVVAPGIVSQTFQTSTNADGEYYIEGVPVGTQVLMAMADDTFVLDNAGNPVSFLTQTVTEDISSDRTINFVMQPQSTANQLSVCEAAPQTASLSGFVFGGAEGETPLPIAGAEVILTGGSARAITDENGFYSIPNQPPGIYSGVVRAEGFTSQSLGSNGVMTIELRRGTNTSNYTLTFERPAAGLASHTDSPVIAGVVRDASGAPVAGVNVSVLNTPGAIAVGPTPDGGNITTLRATTDVAGYFQLRDVPFGHRSLLFNGGGFNGILNLDFVRNIELSVYPTTVVADADRDGIPDSLGGSGSLDTDGDGIGDSVEGYGDADGDGTPNFVDTDSDGDGLLDSVETAADADLDWIPNYLDLDSDNDGIDDADEATFGLDPLVSDATGVNSDPDNDDLTNADEILCTNTDPNDADSDDDGLEDGEEVVNRKTDPNNPDTDGDGLPDGWEVDNGTNPLNPNGAGGPNGDIDNDGLTNQEEFDLGTKANDSDTEDDGLPDGWEVDNSLDPLSATGDDGAQGDPDDDGLTNITEYQNDTNPQDGDSDGDGMPDGYELDNSLDPADATGDNGAQGDPDADGLVNIDEFNEGTNPQNADTDNDGLTDGEEVNVHSTNPLNPDTDGDGLPEAWEVENNLDPTDTTGDNGAAGDPDNDTLANALEYDRQTDPNNPDTDGDTVTDGCEVDQGTEPLVATSAVRLEVSTGSLSFDRRAGSKSFTVSNGGTGTLSWTVEVTAGADFITITQGIAGSGGGEVTVQVTESNSATGRTGTIVVRSDCGGLNSPIEIAVQQSACELPSTPTGVAATDGDFADRVVVTWNAAPGANEYRVFRSETNNSATAVAVSEWITVTTFEDFSAPAPEKHGGTGFGCPMGDDSANGATRYYFVQSRNACGSSEFGLGDSGFRGTPVGEKTTYERVLPGYDVAENAFVLPLDAPLFLRLRSEADIDPASVWGIVETDGLSTDALEWMPVREGVANDGWVRYVPAGLWTPGAEIVMTAGATTVTGEAVGPLTYIFTAESQEAYETRAAEGKAAGVSAEAVAAGAVPALPDGVGDVINVGPAAAYETPQWILLPVPAGADVASLEVYYYQRTLNGGAWYLGANVGGWMVPETLEVRTLDGGTYLRVQVTHGGLVQLAPRALKDQIVNVEAGVAAPLTSLLTGDSLVLLLLATGLVAMALRRRMA